MKKRYSILAKIRDGRYFYLNFNDPQILECLKEVPPPQGLLAIAQWPVYTHAEIEFFVELINGNISYYHLKDRSTDIRETVYFDTTELDY
ncbi:hypothetical protein [Lysinibacillus endophyticus]|uniref:Uncharacterized protein n=1 Tax=Ureibacillus endophyticus TaxID=1978490 RepID=A0A494Z4Q3_9BACL|nr:hypothetical protein [Lysinibacillus endophyticus]MCP1144919.1 hypothetical protein [Lysinibacillus endophyticus]RKQ16965.1 hypothetical protein D8M03_08795 [Lysinibacillus endophyticus]